MTEHVLFIGWNRPMQGREMDATEVFGQLMGYLNKRKDSGTIDSFEPVILGLHGGDLNGFVLIRGSAEKLSGMRRDEDFLNLLTHGNTVIQSMGVIDGWTGQGVTKQMDRFKKFITK